MSKDTSDNQTCDKCGYIFSPFETECPKCAHLAAEHPAASAPIPDMPDSPQPDAMSCRQNEPKLRILMVALAIGLLLIALVAVTTPAEGEETTKSGAEILLLLPLCSLIGYIYGIPGLLLRNRITFASFILWLGFFGLVFFGNALFGGMHQGWSVFEVVMPPLLGAVCLVASALCSCLVHERLDRKPRLIVDLALGLAHLAYWYKLKKSWPEIFHVYVMDDFLPFVLVCVFIYIFFRTTFGSLLQMFDSRGGQNST